MDEDLKRKEIENRKQQLLDYIQGFATENKVNISIEYYNNILFKPQNIDKIYEESDIYAIKCEQKAEDRKIEEKSTDDSIADKKELESYYMLYNNEMQIAIIDKEGKIRFTESYLEQMKNRSEAIYQILKKQNNMEYQLPEPEIEEMENELEDRKYEKEIGESDNQLGQNGEEIANMQENANKEVVSDLEIEQIAKEQGISKEQINACVTIDPTRKITENETFEDITQTKGKYTKTFVVATSNSTFKFIGLTKEGKTKEGKIEDIPGLEQREGNTYGKEVYKVNEDGTEVTEEKVMSKFLMPNMSDGFTVTIGQYGIPNIKYTREVPGQDDRQAMAIDVRTSAEYVNNRKYVEREMDKVYTPKEELRQTVENANKAVKNDDNKQGIEKDDKVPLSSIDADPNNDKVYDEDTVIIIDGRETTLEKEAIKLGYEDNIQEYVEIVQNASGTTIQEKVTNANEEVESQREDEGIERDKWEEAYNKRFMN